MKLIKPKFEIIEQQADLEGMYKQIELSGRTCYKSENKITEGSAKKFVDMMINSGHGAMLEHGTIYLYFPMLTYDRNLYRRAIKYNRNPYSKIRIVFEENSQPKHADNGYYITTNLRVLVENGWMDDLKYLCEPTEYHEKRITVKFTTEVAITREFNRHRVDSMAEESTRYCNYSKDKFGNEISVGLPQEFTEEYVENSRLKFSKDTDDYHVFKVMCFEIWNRLDPNFNDVDVWLFANLACEWSYFKLLDLGWKPQQARKVLPLDLKSELVHTAFISDWKHFFKLRDAKDAHPDAQYLAHGLKEEFIKRRYLSNNN